MIVILKMIKISIVVIIITTINILKIDSTIIIEKVRNMCTNGMVKRIHVIFWNFCQPCKAAIHIRQEKFL